MLDLSLFGAALLLLVVIALAEVIGFFPAVVLVCLAVDAAVYIIRHR